MYVDKNTEQFVIVTREISTWSLKLFGKQLFLGHKTETLTNKYHLNNIRDVCNGAFYRREYPVTVETKWKLHTKSEN